MTPDKNELPCYESSGLIVTSTDNTATTDSPITTVRIMVVEGIPKTLEDSKLSLNGSEVASSSIGPEKEAPPLKKAKLGTTYRYKGCLVRDSLKKCLLRYTL